MPNPRPTDSFPCDYTEGVMAGFTFYEDIEASTVAAHGCTCVLVGSDFARSQTVEQKLEVKGCKRQVVNACT